MSEEQGSGLDPDVLNKSVWQAVESVCDCSAQDEIKLGPTFVKLGQILATRVDLFREEWIAEFELLQDSAPPIEFEELRTQLEDAELDRKLIARRAATAILKMVLVDGFFHADPRQLRLRYGNAGRGLGAGIDLTWPPLAGC